MAHKCYESTFVSQNPSYSQERHCEHACHLYSNANGATGWTVYGQKWSQKDLNYKTDKI